MTTIEKALRDCCERMDRARDILKADTGGQWSMLDTADARTALAALESAQGGERGAFERWALSEDGGWWPEAIVRVGDGYHARAVTKEWKGWQARASLGVGEARSTQQGD